MQNDFEREFERRMHEAEGKPKASRSRSNGADHRERPKRRHFTLTPFAAITLDREPAYLIKGLIPRTGLTVIWGPPKCGKTFWAFDAAMHVALGRPYRGRRVVQGNVVYLAAEGAHGFRSRIEAFRQHHGVADAPFFLIADRADLVADHAALIEDIGKQLGNDKPALVVLDTLNRTLVGSESLDKDMAAYVRAADAIIEAFGCAVAIVHHCGVNESRPRGHTSLTGAADAQLATSRDAADNVVVTVEWMKDGPEGDTIVSRLNLADVGFNSDGDPITSCVVVPVDGEPVPAAANKSESGTIRTFRAAFTEALDGHGQIIRVRNDGPPVRAVEVGQVRAQFNQLHATGEADPKKRADAQRKAFGRAMNGLSTEFPTWVDGDREWIWSVQDRTRTFGHGHSL
jgi:hypothetical protein